MFSPLARGSADWHGGLLYEQFCDESSQVEPLLPQLSFHSTPGNKSARSASSFVSKDGQITLPKTFVTRKGAILLFTPRDELLNHGNENHHKKENVFEAGLKLRTLGNLTNSVLEFGKEADETWEGTLSNQRGNKGDENQPRKDHSAFLHFLRHLDLDNLASDKNVQPGANPDYYLEELRKSSGHSTLKRFRSHTPFSTRTSHSTNTYSHFLEDDEEITNIIHEHLQYIKPEWSQSAGHVSHGVVSSDHMPVREIGHDAGEEFFFPLSPRDSPFPLSMATVSYRGFLQEGTGDSRPKTASIPPTLESPRGNPRITSPRPPPVLRALGSTPNHLEEIVSADVGFGRYHQRGHSSRLRFIRSSSPPVHPGHSRRASPDLTCAQHLGSPEGKSEDWNQSYNFIEEEHEVSMPIDQSGTDTTRRPSSAGGSLQSAVEERVDIQRRSSSAGVASRNSRKSRRSLCSSRSGSASSVSHHNVRSISALSRDADNTGFSEMSDDIQRERSAPARPDEEDVFRIRHNQTRSGGDVEAEPHSEPPTVEADSKDVQPHLDDVARSAAQSPKNHSVTSRLGSPSTRSSSAKCVRENAAGSRVSSASSSEVSATWAEAIEKATESNSPVLSRLETMASAQSDRQKTAHVERGTRTPSSNTANEGRVTEATQGSEVDLTEVSETVVRSQSVAEGVYGDVLNEPDPADQEWPGAMFRAGVEEVEPARDHDDNDCITPELFPTAYEEDSRPSSPRIVPTVKVEESSDTASTRPGDLRAATPEAMVVDANVSHESTRPLITPEVTEEVHVTSTPTVPLEPVPKETTSTRDTAEQHYVGSSHPIPVNARRENQEDNKTQIEPEQPSRVVPRASSPAPIKTDEILHTDLLPSTGLEIEGEMNGRQSPSPYKEMIDIEKSRPSPPLAEEKRNVPVSVGEAVLKYIESGQVPQVRERTSRSRRGSETGSEEKINDNTLKEETVSPQKNKGETPIKKERSTAPMTKPAESTPSVSPKTKASNVSKSKPELKPDLLALDLLKGEDQGMAKMAQPSDDEREARRQKVSGLLTKPNVPKGGKLELEGIGKETDESDSPAAEGLVTRVNPPLDKKKTDLSDLAAIINKDKTQSKKEKKVESKKKSGKPSKSGKKKGDVSVDPKNIDFEAFNTPEMLSEMDDELRQFILEQSSSDVNSTVVDQSNEPMVQEREVLRKESVKTLEVPQSVPEISPEKKDAHSPSKPKKLTKKELTKMRADQRKEERRKKEEEKRLREEETRLLKEREEEAARAKAEAEERQQNIENEKMSRLVEEEEARREEEEALERLKEAKKKAREEREARRAAEAERRKLEVQKKRDEKKKREEELREREKELEQQKMDKERRKAEIEEAMRRREEMERLEEEQRREEERLQALQEEEEQRRLEEEQIREAEAELQRLQEERAYREQMRRIAEMQEAKLRQEEEERRRREEEERRRIEEENHKREEAEKEQKREEQRRVEMSRRLEALARMRAAQAAAHRKALLLKRREQNMERSQNLKFTRCGQHITRPYTFTYFIQIPRKVWEVPIGFNKKKKGFRPARNKPPEAKPG